AVADTGLDDGAGAELPQEGVETDALAVAIPAGRASGVVAPAAGTVRAHARPEDRRLALEMLDEPARSEVFLRPLEQCGIVQEAFDHGLIEVGAGRRGEVAFAHGL